MKVLIVEDDFLIRQIAATLLKKLGCQTVIAADGAQALKHAGEAFDMVFMDCQMPIIDGFEATRRWRALEAERVPPTHIPIIALTGEKDESQKERCFQAGMNDFVSKPLKVEVLREALDKWTAQKTFPSSDSLPDAATAPASSNLAQLMNEYKGFEALLRQLALTYSQEWAQIGTQIERELEQQSASTVFQLAHKFKGQTQTLHRVELARLAQKLEDDARVGDLSTAPPILQKLQSEIKDGIVWLQEVVRHIDELQTP